MLKPRPLGPKPSALPLSYIPIILKLNPMGFEPMTYGLRVHRSKPTELRVLDEPRQTRTVNQQIKSLRLYL